MVTPNQGTVVTDAGETFRAAQAQLTPKQQCKASGGFWDEESQTCLPAKPEPTPETDFRNVKTGEITPKVETISGGSKS